MDQQAREQIRLILDDAAESGRKSTQGHLKSLYAERSSKGVLKSGMTVGAAALVFENDARQFVATSVDRVAAVAKDIEAYVMLNEAMDQFLSYLSGEFGKTVELVVGGGRPQAMAPQMKAELSRMWSNASTRVRRQFEIHQISFSQPLQTTQPSGFALHQSSSTPAQRNKGGKPLAEHWDAMWAEIAVQLWAGDLKPKSQADIKRAMLDWFDAQEIEIGDTAVTERARRLWQKMEATQ